MALWLRENDQSKQWLARRLGVANAQLWRWLSGRVVPPIRIAGSIEKITQGRVRITSWDPPPNSVREAS